MYRRFLPLLLLCISCQLLPAQVKNYRALLAEHHITQRLKYTCLIDQGRLTGDSTLVAITRNNTFGVPVEDLSFDPYQPYPAKIAYEYLHDTLISKTTHYAENGVVLGGNQYQYDSSGYRVQAINQFRPAVDSVFKNWTIYMVRDPQHQLVEEYEEGKKGKRLMARYTYDQQGRQDRCYNNFSTAKRSKWYRKTCYDAYGNIVKTYYRKGWKKQLINKNIFNTENELVENYSMALSAYHICAEGIEYAVRKNDYFLTKNYYDQDGLLIRQIEFLRTIPVWQTVYKYVSTEGEK